LRIANTSPTAASATADLNGKATVMACNAIIARLKEVAAAEQSLENIEEISLHNSRVYYKNEPTLLDWPGLLAAANLRRVNLSEHAHYVTPKIDFDWSSGTGHPFAYHVYGTAIVQVTVDCLRGIYETDFGKIVHDFGKSMSPLVDFGQIEGGLVQGIGWMTMEEVVYDAAGKLHSNALSNYKIPDVYSAPKSIEIEPLVTDRENPAIFGSKAVGEPPLMYGIGVYFAIREAVRGFNPGFSPAFDAPFTPEKVLMGLYP
jgi:xanthine dehydrogenase large subunit